MLSSGITAVSARSAKRAVADFAPARAAHEADFADAERREVVVQHEALGGLAGLQQLDALLVVLGAERDRDQRLRFAAREQRRTVGARQHADFDGDLADLVECAAIRTAALLQHLVAEDALFESVESILAASTFCSSGQRFDHLLLDRMRRASSFPAFRTSACSSRRSVRRAPAFAIWSYRSSD